VGRFSAEAEKRGAANKRTPKRQGIAPVRLPSVFLPKLRQEFPVISETSSSFSGQELESREGIPEIRTGVDQESIIHRSLIGDNSRKRGRGGWTPRTNGFKFEDPNELRQRNPFDGGEKELRW